MIPAFAQVTLRPQGFAEDVQALSDAGASAVELWLTKVEQFAEAHSPEQARKALADRGITPVAASYQGGLLGPDAETRKTHRDQFMRRLDLCQAVGCSLLTVLPELTGTAASLAPGTVDRLAEAAEWAEGHGTRLGLEFRASCPWVNNLQTALALVEASGKPNLGIVLDAWHFALGPSKYEDLALLDPSRLFLVQVCDLAGAARELATDADRILPGEGELPLQNLLGHLHSIGYEGPVSLEAPNPRLWQVSPSQVADLGWQALGRTLSQALKAKAPPSPSTTSSKT